MTEDEEELRMEREQEMREEAIQEYHMFHDEEYFLNHSLYNDIVELLAEFKAQCDYYGYSSEDYIKEMY